MANFNFHGNVTGNIFGDNVHDVQITNNLSEKEKQKINQYIKEIKENIEQDLNNIETIEINQAEKNEIIKALQDIKEHISQSQLDPEKIKQSGEILEKSSYAASICGAIFSLLQLFK